MKIVSSALLGLFLAACASSTDAPAGSATSDIHGGTICLPLDHPRAMPNDQYYRQFASDDAVAAYVKTLVSTGQLAATSGADAAFKEVSHDARLLGLLDQVYAGFRRVYPAATEGLPTAPRIVIVESSLVNAFALGPGFVEDETVRTDQAPWVFFVHTALLNRGGTDTELRGLFAHELGHLVLRNVLPEVRQAIRVVYDVGTHEDGVLGENAIDDAALVAHVEEIRKRTERVGPFPHLGLPTSPTLATYALILQQLVAAATASSASDACTAARKDANELAAAQTAFLPGMAVGDFTPLLPDSTARAKLDALSGAAAASIRSCVAPLTDPDTAASFARIFPALLDAETAVDASATAGTPLVDRVLRAEGPVRAELATLQDDLAHPIDRIRVFDYEEDADDISVRILAAIGDPPTGVGEFVVNALMDANQKAACLADVAAGRPVPFGRFVDPHPASCWRYYHAIQMAKALALCGPMPTGTTAPRGSGQTSVVDKAPKDLVEKGYGTGQR